MMSGWEQNMQRQRWEARADLRFQDPDVKQHAVRFDSDDAEQAHKEL